MGYGYKIYGEKINHLSYEDELKLYRKNYYELNGFLKIVKIFSDKLGMTFGLEKCAKATFTRGKLKHDISTLLDTNTKINELDPEEMYK